ncbi:MAG: outer membrane beta-barrel protein, partial [Bacteroidaceae bacterium]
RASRSIVKSLYMGETIKLNYKIKNTTLGAKVGGTWVSSTSRREDFTTINAADINYALTAVCELPLGLQIGTDLTMYSRYGYDDPEMNTNELIWNARISKKILKNKLTIALDGFDILGNLSSVSRTINAQGRTETYRNVIPSYVMLHAIYRLNMKPKKKPGE